MGGVVVGGFTRAFLIWVLALNTSQQHRFPFYHRVALTSSRISPSPPLLSLPCMGIKIQECLLHLTPPSLPVPLAVVSPKKIFINFIRDNNKQQQNNGNERKRANTHNEARLWNSRCFRQMWISSSAHQCCCCLLLLLLLLLLYTVGRMDDALWIRGMMSCIVAPHVGAVAL